MNPGLKALLEAAQISAKRPPTSGEVGFRIAPRINAAGRMDVARDVIELFSVKDPARARELAAKLDQLNTDRQEEERRILRAVEERFTARSCACATPTALSSTAKAGIAASSASPRPESSNATTARARDFARWREAFGSGRSIRAFHLLEAIESCGHLFSRYGGHSHACGFAMPAANIDDLRTHLDAFARTRLTLADFDPISISMPNLSLPKLRPNCSKPSSCWSPTEWGIPNPYSPHAGSSLPRPPDSERQAREAEGQGGRLRSRGTLSGGNPRHTTMSSR